MSEMKEFPYTPYDVRDRFSGGEQLTTLLPTGIGNGLVAIIRICNEKPGNQWYFVSLEDIRWCFDEGYRSKGYAPLSSEEMLEVEIGLAESVEKRWLIQQGEGGDRKFMFTPECVRMLVED